MYTGHPSKMTTSPVVNGNQLAFNVTQTSRDVPEKQKAFLEKLGWIHGCYHPDTNEELFKKPPPVGCADETRNSWASDLQYNYWHWYEAVAYEFTKFMCIDDDAGEQRNMGSAGQASASSYKHNP